MYYIDEPVTIDKSFIEKPVCSFHIAGRLTIDYINKNTTLELISWKDRESFNNNEESLVTFLTINDSPKFNVDPSLFALRALTTVEGSPFYHKQIKCDYEIEHISQVWVTESEEE